MRDAVQVGDVAESLVLVVPINREHFLIDVGNEKVLPSVSVQIGSIDSHSGARLAVFTECHLGLQRHLLPFPGAVWTFTTIEVQPVLHSVVGDKKVHQPVIIDIGCDNA